MLYILFQADMPAEDKKYQLSENYGIMMTRAIDKEMDGMCDLSKGVREEGRAEGRAFYRNKEVTLTLSTIQF